MNTLLTLSLEAEPLLQSSPGLLSLQESHLEVGCAARRDSGQRVDVQSERVAAGAEQHRRLERESPHQLALHTDLNGSFKTTRFFWSGHNKFIDLNKFNPNLTLAP